MRIIGAIAGHMRVCEVAHKMRRSTRTVQASIALFSLCWMATAASSGAQIKKADDTPYTAPGDQALLVLTRPRRRQASETDIRIVNQGGRCLAVVENGLTVATPLWPGKHMLMVVTGTAPPTVQLFQVKASAGKTYVVILRARVNVKRPIEIEPMRPADQPLEAFPSSIKEKILLEQDLRTCTEWVSWKQHKIAPKAAQAKREWDSASEEARDMLTVHRNDGWTGAQIYPP